MKRRLLQALILVVALTGAWCISVVVYMRFFWDLGPITIDWGLPRAIKEVDPAAWEKLRTGMTTDEVRNLLGDSWSKFTTGTPSKGCCPGDSSRLTYWEYNWTDGLSPPGPSAKAYAVYFDADGRVASFRAPLVPAEARK